MESPEYKEPVASYFLNVILAFILLLAGTLSGGIHLVMGVIGFVAIMVGTALAVIIKEIRINKQIREVKEAYQERFRGGA